MTFLYQNHIIIKFKLTFLGKSVNHRQNQINVFSLKMQFTRKTKKCTKNRIKTIQNTQKIEGKNSLSKKLTFQ